MTPQGAKQKPRKIRQREYDLFRQYGISLSFYDDLFSVQFGKCKICNLETPGKPLHVDHCHTTGKVRGLLCTTCNRGLGHFKDNITNLEKAILYLKGD